ncbi:MAG: ATP-grasp domain-containing protein [Bdellovibrionaceae bacterium]|nr:ATP-grasp domain-containing protein [Pseudobdellovibrionaceae bacterium]
MKETVLDCDFIILNRLPELYSAQRFQAEINRHNLNAKLISPEALINQAPQIETRDLRPVILYRQGEFNFWATQHALSQMPFKIINSPKKFLAARDKWSTAQAWQKNNIPTPKSLLASILLEKLPAYLNQEEITKILTDFFDLMASHLNVPFVFKKRFSSQGRGVFLIKNATDLLDVLKQDEMAFHNTDSLEIEYFAQNHVQNTIPESHLWQQLTRWIAQESITESFGMDVRVFISNSSNYSVERKNQISFRSNLHQGGTASATSLSELEANYVRRVHELSGLSYSGIDFLRTSNGPVFLETNPSPGFEGIEKAYPNVNIAYDLLLLMQTI